MDFEVPVLLRRLTAQPFAVPLFDGPDVTSVSITDWLVAVAGSKPPPSGTFPFGHAENPATALLFATLAHTWVS